MRYSTFFTSILATSLACVKGDPVITSFKNSLTLSTSFDPIKAAYWTGLPHHRRTPFSVSPDGKSAYLAYLDSTYSMVHVQQVDTTTFAAVGTPFSTAGYEAAGLVAQDDGFALMATVKATGTTDLPPDDTPVVALIRVKAGAEAWRTALNGPGVHASAGLSDTAEANGDLVYSAASGLYAAYFVVAAYSGDASGHFGDSIQYVDDAGALQDIASSSTFGCSHNTGIALEAADAPPFASVCAEDHGAIWLNTETRYMSGVKIANENTTNGVSGEPMGGMSGSYSNLALFPGTTNYIFAWQSRGALDLYTDTWMGSPYTQCSPRWLNHNVAIATMSSKSTLTGTEASSIVGAAEGDSQVNWITKSDTIDHQNVRVAALNSNLSLVSWESLTSPKCEPVPLSCSGTFAGTSFQFVDSAGAKVGSEVADTTGVTVSGDMAVVGGKVCWPYVDQTWDLSAPKDKGTLTTSMSFACAAADGAADVSVSSSSVVVSSTASPVASSSVVVVPSSSVASMKANAAVVASSSTVPSVILSTATVVPVPVSSAASTTSISNNAVATPNLSTIPEFNPSSSITSTTEASAPLTTAAGPPTIPISEALATPTSSSSSSASLDASTLSEFVPSTSNLLSVSEPTPTTIVDGIPTSAIEVSETAAAPSTIQIPSGTMSTVFGPPPKQTKGWAKGGKGYGWQSEYNPDDYECVNEA